LIQKVMGDDYWTPDKVEILESLLKREVETWAIH
jgi:hypothetical protein